MAPGWILALLLVEELSNGKRPASASDINGNMRELRRRPGRFLLCRSKGCLSYYCHKHPCLLNRRRRSCVLHSRETDPRCTAPAHLHCGRHRAPNTDSRHMFVRICLVRSSRWAVRLLNMHLLARSFRIAHPTRIDRCRTGIARTKAPLRFYTKVVAGIVVVFFFIIFARTGAWRFVAVRVVNARIAIDDNGSKAISLFA